ncbi:MAG: macro domain-containing protein [Lysobacter sp.]|nr:macro domain-containing protein [Lysobacter sp.]
MPISVEVGDIFATPGINGFAHGCNCAGAMGKGIAVTFRERWPRMYDEYRRRCKAGSFQLGDVFVWKEDGDVVFNLGTQSSWTKKAELWAVEKALTEMIREAEVLCIQQVALPRIGAGLGGLEWASVRTVLEELGGRTQIQLRVCDVYTEGQPLRI